MWTILKIFALVVFVGVFLLPNVHTYTREDFPHDFVFGSSTSAYQIEGAANEDGRKPSIWDTFVHAGNWHQGNGDVACDHYHKYKEDVQLMANMGLEAYRFSISWSRLIPDGRGPINPKGLLFYNNLINELIRHGIQPHVTLHHWDIPQILDDEYGGWVSRRIVKDFTAYAHVCFREFGDRVKYWTTVNEGNVFAMFGYDLGLLPPQRCSSAIGKCSRGNSSTEPYLAAHHMLLAHASAARLYRKKFQGLQHGFIGFNILGFGLIPKTNTSEDIIATQRAQEFLIGWFLNPLTYGDYPDIIKKNAGSRLPLFTEKESNLVKGSIDFLGLNYYYTFYIKNSLESLQMKERDYMADMAVEITRNGGPTYEIPITTWNLQELLDSLKNKYGNIPIYIHENGQKTARNSSLDDWPRVKYLNAYIGSLRDVLRSGLNVRGYFVWSLLDGLELVNGYDTSFGLYYIDLKDPSLKRKPKLSVDWYTKFLNKTTKNPNFTMEINKYTTLLSQAPLLHNAT
ncbi:PREDICTED: beta-glucosidase 11-like isoform X1 [Lupinus angustifolius]|uniref:beta-glucosidase 11-like isoform X1 n=2 Tax=Lupinus angustifolius TaxID=3871 RepID=UPI00092E922B|nr:PREDICTED: beta-glucosidase 11-like isoform X1 [Lupinus angustifolius]